MIEQTKINRGQDINKGRLLVFSKESAGEDNFEDNFTKLDRNKGEKIKIGLIHGIGFIIWSSRNLRTLKRLHRKDQFQKGGMDTK